MAVLKDKLKDITKKVANQISQVSNNNTSNNVNSSNEPSWIGSGISPRTGEVTYGGSANTGTAISNGSSYNEDLQRLKRLQQEANVQQLKAQKDKTLQALAEREATVKPTFQNQRNATSAQSQRSARSFNEYLANRGLTNSGAGAQAEINRASTLQNNLAAINTAETNELNEIARARANAEADFANNLAIANSQIEADYFSKLVEENQRQRLIDEQLKQQAQYQYADDYQARINELIAQGYSPNSREVLQLQALRGQKANNTYSNANSYNNAIAQIQSGYINYNNAAQLGMTVEQAQDYYNYLQEQARITAQKEQEEKAWDRYVAQTELNNATALNNANIANKNASTQNYISQKTNRDNSKQISLQDIIQSISKGEIENPRTYVDALYNNGQITEATKNTMYSINTDWQKARYEEIQNTIDTDSYNVNQAQTKLDKLLENGLITEDEWNHMYDVNGFKVE